MSITNLSGVYSLVIFLDNKTTITVGALGSFTFSPGYYVYTGSALGPGGLKARLKHHINKNKSCSCNFWHIDYLIAHKNTTLFGIIATKTNRNLECKINRYIKEKERVKIPIPRFGASDCKKNCISHLFFFPYILIGDILVRKIANAYANFNRPIILLRDNWVEREKIESKV